MHDSHDLMTELEVQAFGGGSGPVDSSQSAIASEADLPGDSQGGSGFGGNTFQNNSASGQAGSSNPASGQNVSGVSGGASASAHPISGEATNASAGGSGGGADQAGTSQPPSSAIPQNNQNTSDNTVGVDAGTNNNDSGGEEASGDIPRGLHLGYSKGWIFNVKGSRFHISLLTKVFSSAPFGGSFLTNLKVGVGFKYGTEFGSSTLPPHYTKGPGSISSYDFTFNETSFHYEKGYVKPQQLDLLANPLSSRFPTVFPNNKTIFSSFATGRAFTLPDWLIDNPFKNTQILGTIYAENSYWPWFSKDKQVFLSLKHSPGSVQKALLQRFFRGRFVFLTSFHGHLVGKPTLLGPHLFLNEEQSKASLPITYGNEDLPIDIGKPLPEKSGLEQRDYLYLRDQFNPTKDSVKKEVSSNTLPLLRKLNNIEFNSKNQFNELQRRSKIFEETALRNNQKVLNAINTGREEQAECCDTHTRLLKGNQEALSKIQEKLDNSKNLLSEALLGSGFFVFFRSLYSFLCSFCGGAVIAVVLGVGLAFLYITSDFYLVYYHKEVKNERVRNILYIMAYIVRFVSSGGVFGAVFVCYTHSFITGRKLPLFDFFKSLPFNSFDSSIVESERVPLAGDALVHYIGVKIGPVLKQSLVALSGYWAIKKISVVYSNMHLALIIYGSSFTFAFCRIQLSTCYLPVDKIHPETQKNEPQVKLEETRVTGWRKLPLLSNEYRLKDTLFEAARIASGYNACLLCILAVQDVREAFKKHGF